MAQKPFFVTTPIYYINSTPHVGHAYTQIAADARARFERARGRQVYFLTGTDENALKVARAAQEQNRDPQEFCDDLAAAFQKVWAALNISYDDFIRTTAPRHRKVVTQVVQQLWDGSHLELGTYSGWYSVPDETFFRDDDTIERDGEHFIAAPSDDQSKSALEWVEETGHFFKLSQFGEPLLGLYAAQPEMLQPASRRNETLSFIRMGLRDTSISRVQEWGIPMPPGVPEAAGHVVYVWFPDALLNYASAPGYLSAEASRRDFFHEVWPPDLQLMSKDIFTRFHATLWPALLQALGLDLPKQLFAHGFWTVEGRKISKRDPQTLIEPIAFCHRIAAASGCQWEVAVDALRYYCLREVTFGLDGDFSPVGCINRYNSDLANGLGNLLQRTLSMLERYFDRQVPESSGQQRRVSSTLVEATAAVEADYEALNFSSALSRVWEVMGAANRLIEEEKPWAKIKVGGAADIASLMSELLQVCDWCAAAVEPVMPSVARLAWSQLGFDTHRSWGAASAGPLPAGHLCRSPQAIFPRANLDTFQASGTIMQEPETVFPATTSAPPPAPSSNPLAVDPPTVSEGVASITIDDFAKVQLRVGKVVEAERVPKADKLLRLQVDLGNETRQILAGIAQHYAPGDLVGKQVIVVANLAPRTLRGYESQGMVLASTHAETGAVVLLAPLETVPPGSEVR